MEPQDDRPAAREPFLNVPAVVLALIGAIVAAHLVRVFAPEAVADMIVGNLALDPAVYSPVLLRAAGVAAPAGLAEQLVPLLGHVFLHGTWTHLALDGVWLLVFGPTVARRFGSAAFLLFFFACALCAALVFVAMNWGHNIAAFGASGAIAGAMAAAFRMIRLGESWIDPEPRPLLPLLSNQVTSFSLAWVAFNVLTAYLGTGMWGAAQSAGWLNVGGYFAGLLLAGPFDRLFGTRLPADSPEAP